MAKTDWQMGDTVQPEDMNRIGQEINQLREDVDNIEVPPASTSQAGIVQLSNAVDSTSETQAATPKAVKQAYDQAVQAFQLGNERKLELVDALIAIGVTASTNESWDDLITKVSSVIRATGNANAGDVLSGKTFSNAGANGLTGTMPNRGAVSTDLTSQGQQYTIPAGYHNGTGKVTANISNLTAGNIRAGVTVGGVTGTFSQFSNGATAAQILSGRSAAVNGTTVNGSMPNRTGHVNAQSISRNGTTLRFRPLAGYYNGTSDNSVQYSDPNFFASNIKKGIDLFGLVGSWDGHKASGNRTVEIYLRASYFTTMEFRGLDFSPKFILVFIQGTSSARNCVAAAVRGEISGYRSRQVEVPGATTSTQTYEIYIYEHFDDGFSVAFSTSAYVKSGTHNLGNLYWYAIG